MRNSKGLTLIEVLLAISIATIFVGILWMILLSGVNYSNISTEKNSIQQEANYILKLITKFHQTSSGQYSITFDQNPHATYIKLRDEKEKKEILITNENYVYTIFQYNNPEDTEPIQNNLIINPNSEDLSVNIMIENVKEPKVTFELKTIISKLRGE